MTVYEMLRQKMMTPSSEPQAEVAVQGVRAKEVAKALDHALANLNTQLQLAESFFVERMGPDARGRTKIEDGKHLVFRNGKMFVEEMIPKKPPRVTPILSSSKEVRMAVTRLLPNLWNACGGSPPMKETLGDS